MEIFSLLGKIAVSNDEANKNLEETTGNANSAQSKITEAFKKIGTAVATYFAFDKITDFGKACLEAAANAQASESQFSQVFGDLEGNASASLSAIADSAGVSENRMKGSFTKIAAFAKTTGMDTENSLELTERAMVAVADSAAFYDRTLEETTESLQSFLKGNYENDAALGLSCTETTRNAAANKLYGKSFNELSEAQKQLTLLKMVEDANELSGALGQAARESDTWTNQTGNLTQAWTDFKAIIGDMFLEKAVGVVGWLAEKVENLGTVAQTVAEIWNEILGEAISGAGEAFSNLREACSPILEVFAQLFESTTGVSSGFDIFRIVCSWVEIALSTVTEKIQGVVFWIEDNSTKITDIITGLWEGVQLIWATIGQPIWDMIQECVGIVRDVFSSRMSEIQEFVSTCFSDIQEFWTNNLQPCFQAIGEFIENVLAPIFESVFNERIGPVIDTVFNFIKDIWENTLKPVFTGITDFLTGIFTGNWQQVWDGILSILTGIWNGIVTAISTAITLAWETIVTVFTAVYEFVSAIWTSIRDWIATKFEEIKANIAEKISEVKENLAAKFEQIRTNISEKLTSAKETVMSIWSNIRDGVAERISAVKENIAEKFDTIKSNITDKLTAAKETVTGIFDDIKSNISEKITAAKDKVNEVVEKIKSIFNFKWSFPSLKLPHVSVSGSFSLNPISYPKFSLSWYKKAMDNPMILDDPTIFGMSKDGQLLGGGEAGDEVVAGANTLMDMISAAVEQKTSEQTERLIAVMTAVLEAIQIGNRDMLQALLAGQDIVWNNREVARLVRTYA